LHRRPRAPLSPGDPGPAARCGPPLGVALEREEDGRHPRGREVAALGDASAMVSTAAHLAPAHAALPGADRSRAGETWR
jgi:hypothetical protein